MAKIQANSQSHTNTHTCDAWHDENVQFPLGRNDQKEPNILLWGNNVIHTMLHTLQSQCRCERMGTADMS